MPDDDKEDKAEKDRQEYEDRMTYKEGDLIVEHDPRKERDKEIGERPPAS